MKFVLPLMLLASVAALGCTGEGSGSSSNQEPAPERTSTMSDACWQFCEPFVSYFDLHSEGNDAITAETCEERICDRYEVSGCEVESERYLRCGGEQWRNAATPTPYDADCEGDYERVAARCAADRSTECMDRPGQCDCTAEFVEGPVEVTCIETAPEGGGGAGAGGAGGAEIGGGGPVILGAVQCACANGGEVWKVCFQDTLTCSPTESCCYADYF